MVVFFKTRGEKSGFMPDRYDIEGIFLPKKFQNPTFKYKKFLPKK